MQRLPGRTGPSTTLRSARDDGDIDHGRCDASLDRRLRCREGDGARGKFVYFQNGGVPGTVVEMSHLTPTRRRIFDGVRVAAVNWAGKDPIRPMASLSATL